MYEAARRRFGRWARSLRDQQRIADIVAARYGETVGPGIFAGMRWPASSADGCVVPKLLGCYEEELHDVIRELADARPSLVVDVGCASGWYVCGLARALPDAQVIGFEIEPGAVARARANIVLNALPNARVEARFLTPEGFDDLLDRDGTDVLIIMDIEGGERDLLRLDLAPRLAAVSLLVELHDCLRPGVTPTLLERFEQTHSIELIDAVPRAPSLARYPRLDALSTADWNAAVDERRPAPMQWGLFRPHR